MAAGEAAVTQTNGADGTVLALISSVERGNAEVEEIAGDDVRRAAS